MSSSKISTRDLILPAIIVICTLSLAQDPKSRASNLDVEADVDQTDLEYDEHEDAEVEVVEAPKATVAAKPYYPPSRSNVYPQIVKQKPPPFHYAVWDDDTGNICILAKMDASFTITYNSAYGKQQMMDRIDAMDATVDGRCESFLDEEPVMDVKWRGGFTFRLIFQKVIPPISQYKFMWFL